MNNHPTDLELDNKPEAPFEYGGFPKTSQQMWGSLNAPQLGYKRKPKAIYGSRLGTSGKIQRRTTSNVFEKEQSSLERAADERS